MTLTEIKEKILNKYKTGQVVTLKYRDNEKRVKEKRKDRYNSFIKWEKSEIERRGGGQG